MKPQVEFTSNDFLVRIGDREVRDVDPVFDDQTVELIRTGYMCIDCFQRWESAFPEECPFPICDNKPRTEQSLKFLARFKGKDETLWDYEQEIEPIEDYMRRKGVWLPEKRK